MNSETIAIILSYILGPIVAILTVFLEYRKDKKEKLQDRKDMWLDVHYKDLSNELQNFANVIIKNDAKDFREKLETGVIRYSYCKNTINVIMNRALADTMKNRKNSLLHLMHGYKEIHKGIGSLFAAEGKYRYQLNEAIKKIFNCIKTLMGNNFNCLEPGEDATSTKNGKLAYYNIYTIYYNLVENIIGNPVTINVRQLDKDPPYLYFNYPSNFIIMGITPEIQLKANEACKKFKDSVWNPLNKKYKEKIKDLYNIRNELRKYENEIKSRIQYIINDYNLGRAIEGYCDSCDKIYHETDITKLRPKL